MEMITTSPRRISIACVRREERRGEKGEERAGDGHSTHVKYRHGRLEQLGLIPPLERQLEPFPDDIEGDHVVNPRAKVVVAGVVPNLRQYLET